MEIFERRNNISRDDIFPILPLRADIATNKQTLVNHGIITIILLSFCFLFKLLPQAQRIQNFQAKQWHKIQQLDINQVNPFNRNMKVFVYQTNNSNPIDNINKVQIYSLIDGIQQERKFNMYIQDIEKYQKFDQGKLTYYLGDLSVLDKPFFRIKVIKFDRVDRQLQQTDFTYQQDIQNSPQQLNYTQNNTLSHQNNTQSNISNITNATSSQKSEQQLIKQEIQRKKKEQQQKQRIEKQRIEKEQEKQQQQKERKKMQELKKTNIAIKVKLMSEFATILQFALNYLLLLVIIYFVADNPNSPKSISLILTLTANPLIFIHLSSPSGFTNFLDSLCNSAPLLYLSIWIYYTHWQLKYQSFNQSNLYLIIKLILSISIYILDVIRLNHFDVQIIQTIILIIVLLILSNYLWGMYLNLKKQEHRNKILVPLSLHYLILSIVLTYIAGGWKQVIGNIVYQIYGISLIVLTGRRKKLVIRSWEQQQQQYKKQYMERSQSGRQLQAQQMNQTQSEMR